MRTLERIIASLCLAAVVTLSLMWGAFDAWVPKQADLSRILGFILGLTAIATAYTWTRSDLVAERHPAPGRVRIRAVTSQIIHQAPATDTKDLEANISAVLRDGKDRYARNNIDRLEIRRDVNLPNEYEIIVDDHLILWGMYILDPDDRTGVRFTKATVIGTTGGGNRELIQSFIERFDSLFAKAQHDCSSEQPV